MRSEADSRADFLAAAGKAHRDAGTAADGQHFVAALEHGLDFIQRFLFSDNHDWLPVRVLPVRPDNGDGPSALMVSTKLVNSVTNCAPMAAEILIMCVPLFLEADGLE